MATKKLNNLYEAWQGNVYPGMLDHLANHLKVSADSLSRLDLGWAPIVEFKHKVNFQGWWAIPERTAAGELAGLSLRSQSDMKVMAPGSNHGLIYEINPQHEHGHQSYKHGAHNWVRTMDAGVLCPICGKPDGCLVSAENPEDPKAVICIRTPSPQKMKFGFLHIRKEEGRVKPTAQVLLPSDKPVIIVEGMTDAATAMDLGFVAVGRPSNLACMEELKDLVRGRNAIIIGENDDINPTTGKRPGEEGMIAAFQALKNVCPDLTMALPPAHAKDLRQWKSTFGLTAEQLLEHVKAHGRQPEEETVLPDPKPATMARAWLAAEHRMAGRYTLRRYNSDWYKYVGPKYERAEEMIDIKGPLYKWADNKYVMEETAQGPVMKPVICNRALTANIVESLYSPDFTPLDLSNSQHATQQAPAWINGAVGPNPHDIIPFSNGLLWVSKYLEGARESEYFLDSTPDYFTTFALPFPFDPLATYEAWKGFLRTTIGHNPQYVRLLRQWFGYCLTPDTSQHKMMLLRGPSRSGKGTALRVLHEIVGVENAADMTFTSLAQDRFALESLIDKQVVLMNEAIMPRQGDRNVAMEVLLKMTGDDAIRVARKFKSAIDDRKLTARITMSANALPEIPDPSGALAKRLLIIDFEKTFFGREDTQLTEKLKAESAGIVLWALGGLRDLRQQKVFTIPDRMAQSIEEWRLSASPLASFVDEACEVYRGVSVDKNELFDCWEKWADERGMTAGLKSRFLEKLRLNFTDLTISTTTKGGHKFSMVHGLKLRPWAERQYLGKVNA